MLLGLINLGSSSAFTAFVSVGVIALAAAYAIPIFLSLWHGREEVAKAPWTCGGIVGRFVNVVALAWIAFELVLFSMPTALPVTAVSMNYASVVFVGFMAISAVWYVFYARKCKFFFWTGLDGDFYAYNWQIIRVRLSRMLWIEDRFEEVVIYIIPRLYISLNSTQICIQFC